MIRLATGLFLSLTACAAARSPAASIANNSAAGPVFFVRTAEKLVLTTERNVDWFVVVPELRAYDNRPGPQPRLDAVRYRRWLISTHPSKTHEVTFGTPGTRYFCAGAVVPKEFRTAEPIHRRYPVVQVVVRSHDSYLGFLGELFATPFIMGPAPTQSGWHQTDQRVGSDCAAFATYGRRRLGKPVLYAGPRGIVQYLRPLHRKALAPPALDGRYRDARGRAIRVGANGARPGDLLHFGEQVSVFEMDRGIRGELDAGDLILQSWGATPHSIVIRNCGFFDRPVRLYRWR